MAALATLHVTFTTADPKARAWLVAQAGITECMTVDMVLRETVQYSVDERFAAAAVALLEADPLVVDVVLENLPSDPFAMHILAA